MFVEFFFDQFYGCEDWVFWIVGVEVGGVGWDYFGQCFDFGVGEDWIGVWYWWVVVEQVWCICFDEGIEVFDEYWCCIFVVYWQYVFVGYFGLDVFVVEECVQCVFDIFWCVFFDYEDCFFVGCECDQFVIDYWVGDVYDIEWYV